MSFLNGSGLMQFASLNRTTTFSPTSVANLFAWYDVSDSTTITKSSNRISKVLNKEGTTARDLLQATGANQPLWISANRNGLDVMSFDSSDRGMRTGTISKTVPLTIFMACLLPPDTASTDVMIHGTGAGGERLDKNATANIFSLVSGSTLSKTTTAKINTWQNNFIKFNNASSEIDIGGEIATGTTATNGTWVVIGINAYNVFDFGAVWKIGEILFYDAVISGTDKTNIQNYLKNKWALPT